MVVAINFQFWGVVALHFQFWGVWRPLWPKLSIPNLKNPSFCCWINPLRAGCLAVRKGWVSVAKGGNSSRQLCKIYWLSAVPPACKFYLQRWSDIANYALDQLSPIKQHLMSLLFSGVYFLMSLFKLSNFLYVTKRNDFLCQSPQFWFDPTLPDYDRLLDYQIYERSQIRFSVIVLCDSLNGETAWHYCEYFHLLFHDVAAALEEPFVFTAGFSFCFHIHQGVSLLLRVTMGWLDNKRIVSRGVSHCHIV